MTSENYTQDAFSRAVERLGAYHRNHLYAVCTLLGQLVYFDWPKDVRLEPLKSLVHFPMVHLLSRAIHLSTAKDTFPPIRRDAFLEVWNLLAQVFDHLPYSNYQADHMHPLELLADTAQSQFPVQNANLLTDAAHNQFLLEYVPDEDRNILRQLRKDDFIDVAESTRELLGMSFKDFVIIGISLETIYHKNFNLNLLPLLERFARKVTYFGQNIEFNILIEALLSFPRALQWTLFPPQALTHPTLAQATLEKVVHYLHLLSIDSTKTRERQGEMFGKDALHTNALNTLQRHPLIRLERPIYVPQGWGNITYLAPSLHYWRIAMQRVPYLLHTEQSDPEYFNRFRGTLGYVQEGYLLRLLKHGLPNSLIICEYAYKVKREPKKGPDFVIKEENQEGVSTLFIESKARRVRLHARVRVTAEGLREEFKHAEDALKNLKWKIDHLFNLPALEEQRRELGLSELPTRSLAVAVIGEGVPFLHEIYRVALSRDLSTSGELNLSRQTNGLRWVLLSLRDFERAVEIARYNGESLYSILDTFEKNTSDPNNLSAQSTHFGFRPFVLTETLLGKALEEFTTIEHRLDSE